MYCSPTKGSSSSPSLAGWIANRSQPMKGKLDTFTSQSLFQYENGASFGMDPSHHCPSYTSDRHFCKVLTLADVLVGVVVGMAFLEDCVRLRKVVSDVRHAAFTMGLHRAYRIHVHKLLNSATVRRTMLLCSLRTGWLKSLTRIEAEKTGSLLLLRRCFESWLDQGLSLLHILCMDMGTLLIAWRLLESLLLAIIVDASSF